MVVPADIFFGRRFIDGPVFVDIAEKVKARFGAPETSSQLKFHWLDFILFNAINILAGRGEPLPETEEQR